MTRHPLPPGSGPFDTTTKPILLTSVLTSTRDGRFIADNGAVWAYFSVPLAPTLDAKTIRQRLDASRPLLGALSELAGLTKLVGVHRRRLQQGNYRRYQLLSINLDSFFDPPSHHPLHDMLRAYYAHHRNLLIDRVVLLGVQLTPSMSDQGFTASFRSVVSAFMEGRAPLSDFDKDFTLVRSLMARHGLGTPTPEELALARSWWNNGSPSPVYYLAEPSCYHMFRSADSARRGHDLYAEHVPAHEWPPLQGHSVLTFASVADFHLPWVDVLDPGALWVSDLINNGAVCIAINGLIEPGVITAKEVDAQSARYESDIKDRYKVGKVAEHEQEKKLETLDFIRQVYAGSTPSPISTQTSIIAAIASDGSDLDQMITPGIDLAVLESRQIGAMGETYIAPTIRTNPALHDLPLTTIVFSGICSLSRVGDDQDGSAFVGFTEMDRQPVWANVGAAMTLADSPPLVGIFGQSGSGKTMLLVWLLIQFALLGHKTVFVDPKEKSDFTALFDAFGGTTINLGDIVSSDGIVDPLRFSVDPADGLAQAASILRFINPWGSRGTDMEVPLLACLNHGIQLGARSILSALYKARDDGDPHATSELIDPVADVARSVPLAAALIGSTDTGERLAFGTTLTQIRVGDVQLDLPQGKRISSDIPISQRIAVALIRMIVRGSTIAVRGNEGVVGLDEAWIFFDSAGDALIELGRLARSQSVAVYLATQRVTDATEADLIDFISSGYILGMNSRDEAIAACTLLNLEPTEERLGRILAPATMSGTGGLKQPNYNSLRALVKPGTREVIRGSVAIVADVSDRAVTTEIRLPSKFLALASTNRLDREKRESGA